MKIAVEPMLLEPYRKLSAFFGGGIYEFKNSPDWDNIGNYFISKALVDILDFQDAVLLSKNSSDDAIKYVNENCSVYIIRGATMLGKGKISDYLPVNFVSKIKIPIVWIGYGPESPLGVKNIELTRDDVYVLKYIHDNSYGSIVRGDTSAEVLNKHGIRNVYPLGCPTIYWSKMPENKIRQPSWDDVAWSWREYLYSPNMEDELRNKQFKAVSMCRDKSSRLSIIMQDMSERHWVEYSMANKQGGIFEYFDSLSWPPRLIKKHVHLDKLDDSIQEKYKNYSYRELINWMKNNIFYSFDVHSYHKEINSKTFVLGCRLHGNMIGLSHGTPAYFYAYDERIKELVDLLKVPYGSFSSEEFLIPNLDELDYSLYEKQYKSLYVDFYDFLKKSSIKNNLQSPYV
ncbi:polysaccharide pyruvyl transferase family protein [Microbulbifer sp. 2205BS26-8]|uniref:polysaccharide pyruvyl transferase family protein n=1 Tax=Microbulbifer sp. 2205BS26-8 TaxID=3064386 RepID=UPI00273F2011|nr:polysaccharide pyruvyl transferase family protein [Microbulbifer sp. 2205BS26-8]MDP5209204.1 polysaccharide pyruvyl transferase family protein [Microbulbifer sp. 2205BS26-8]